MKKKFNGWLAAEIAALIVLIGCLGIIVMRTERQMQYNDIRTETYEKWYTAQKATAFQAASATPEPTPLPTLRPTPESTTEPSATLEPAPTPLPNFSSTAPKTT